ncbi:MAG: hypothetical protein A2583_05655 [Bdellovibrionales bacterium RIFOXYD1_FULL_53_11]|nr:MAG: hypothetical protein A2583_05655 [Bdellovibrionales bacterium RIFOXYD1_FULL_53_11]
MTVRPPPVWNETTLLFGGAFDPPHLGHRKAVEGLFAVPGARRVVIVPTAKPPHKVSHIACMHRLAMAKLNFEGPGGGEILFDLCEMDRNNRTGVPSYSFETIAELGPKFGRLAMVTGADQFDEIHTWHRFPDVLGATDWVILERRPGGHARALEKLSALEASGLVRRDDGRSSDGVWRSTSTGSTLAVFPTDAPVVSSTLIRQQISRTGAPPEDVLLPAVSAYLKEHRLYGSA